MKKILLSLCIFTLIFNYNTTNAKEEQKEISLVKEAIQEAVENNPEGLSYEELEERYKQLDKFQAVFALVKERYIEEKTDEEIIELAAVLTGYYATKSRGKKVKLNIINN